MKHYLRALTAGILSAMLIQAVPAHASETTLLRPSDYISYDNIGNPVCYVDHVLQKGKFSLSANYQIGDIIGDGEINSKDASAILMAATKASVSGKSEVFQAVLGYSEEQAMKIADINEDGYVNAIDAAMLLSYAASAGTGVKIPMGFGWYYADEDGILRNGLIFDKENQKVYYAGDNYQLVTGWVSLAGHQYYFDEIGEGVLNGWKTADDGKEYYFADGIKQENGWITTADGKYYLNADGTKYTGVLEENGNVYEFDADGRLIQDDPVINYDFNIPDDIRSALDNAERNPGIRQIPVYDRQYPSKGEPIEFTIRLSDKDYQIIEAFAAEHFTPQMTMSERLYVTWEWIHYNVTYAKSSSQWNQIESLSYPDAIFNHKLGQCVQYNGAMAAVLAYYGYDVYMVKGWTNPPKNTTQHYWTEVMLNGTRYYVETGNYGKNGSYWKYFFEDANNVDYTRK